MSIRRSLPLAGVALAAAGIVACGSGGSNDSTAPPSPAASFTDAQRAFLAGLGSVSADLVRDKQTALDRGANVCADLADGKPAATVLANTKARYSVTDDQAATIVGLAKTTICA